MHPPVPWRLRELLDPDFDEMGGGLTLAQIREPLVPPDEDPPEFWARQHARERARARYAKEREQRLAREQLARARAKLADDRERLRYWKGRLLRAQTKTWPKFDFWNPRCNACVPYNWQFTPNYWATGQKDLFE